MSGKSEQYYFDDRKKQGTVNYEEEEIKYDGSVYDKDLFIRRKNPQSEGDIPKLDSIYNDGVKASLKKKNEVDEIRNKLEWQDAGVATWVTKGSMATGIKEAAGGVVDFVTQDPMNHVNNIKSGMQESADSAGKTAMITAAKRMLENGEIDQQEYLNILGKADPQSVKDKVFYENYYGPKADLAYIRNSKNQTAINNLNNFLGSDDFKSMIGNKEIADKLGIPVELLKDEETRVWAAQRIGKLNNESPLEVANIVKSNPGLLNVFQDERAFVATPANEIKKMAAYESKLSLGVFSGLSLAEGGLNAWENSRTNDLAFKMLIGQADDNDVSEWKKRIQSLKTAYQPESLF